MNGIEKQAAFYRGYLTDERSLVPLTIRLTSLVTSGCSSTSSPPWRGPPKEAVGVPPP
jgi:hypothetical protein